MTDIIPDRDSIPDKVLLHFIFAKNGHYPAFQVCLMSRDELNVLVVSYAELKNCLEQVTPKYVLFDKYDK